MSTVNLGRVGYVHKGTYGPAAIYEKYDVVFYNHGSFLYIGESASGHSPLDPAYWQAMLDPAEMNKATAAAVAAVDEFNQRISSLASPFSVSGNPVSCYPVRDYPLQVISHFLPLQAGQGDPAPGNIRPLSPVSRFSLFHGEKEIPAYLENPLYGGDYHWREGKITGIAGYLELDGTEGWYLNSNGDTSYFVLNFPDVTAIENKAYMSHFSNHPGLAFSDPAGKYNVFRWQNHNSGVTRLCVRPDLKQYATLDAFKAFLAAQKAAGTPVQLVYFADDPAEETGYPKEEILSGAGENTFSTDNGTVTVSGPLDPAYQNAQQEARLAALEAAILNA